MRIVLLGLGVAAAAFELLLCLLVRSYGHEQEPALLEFASDYTQVGWWFRILAALAGFFALTAIAVARSSRQRKANPIERYAIRGGVIAALTTIAWEAVAPLAFVALLLGAVWALFSSEGDDLDLDVFD